jgi:hypothetical protein
MDAFTVSLTAGGVSMLVLELVKWIVRRYILKDASFDFHPNVYKVAIPILNVGMIPLLAWLGVEGYVMPSDWGGFARGAVMVALASITTLVSYDAGLKPLKEYTEERKLVG